MFVFGCTATRCAAVLGVRVRVRVGVRVRFGVRVRVGCMHRDEVRGGSTTREQRVCGHLAR